MLRIDRTTLRKVIAAVLHHAPDAEINDASEIASLIVAEISGLRFCQVNEIQHYITEMIIEKRRNSSVEPHSSRRRRLARDARV